MISCLELQQIGMLAAQPNYMITEQRQRRKGQPARLAADQRPWSWTRQALPFPFQDLCRGLEMFPFWQEEDAIQIAEKHAGTSICTGANPPDNTVCSLSKPLSISVWMGLTPCLLS